MAACCCGPRLGRRPPRRPSPAQGQPGLRALADHRPFEFGKAPDHLHEHPAGGGGRINGFRQAAKAGLGLCDLFQNMEEILQGAGQSIQFPDHDDIPRAELIEEPMELRTVPAPAGGLLGEQPLDPGGA